MSVARLALTFLTLALTVASSAEGASVLAQTAATMAPGTWAVVPMSNVNLTATGFNNIANGGPGYDGWQPGWNSKKRKLYIETTEHGSVAAGDCTNWPNDPHTCWKPLWTYDDATDTWTINGPTLLDGGLPVVGVHVWNHIAWDEANEVMYLHSYYGFSGNPKFYRFCVNAGPAGHPCASQGANTWARITDLAPAGANCCEAIVWHPGLNGGTLLYFDGEGNGASCGALYGYREGVGWSTVDAGAACKFNVGDHSVLAAYSPRHQVAVFGGSGTHFWKIDNVGTITQLNDAPCSMGLTNGIFTSFVPDPVSGNVIALGCTPTGQLWEFNPTAASGSQWSQLASSLGDTSAGICFVRRVPAEPCSFDFYGIPISTYGVIGYWKWINPTTAEFWIYKHKEIITDGAAEAWTTRSTKAGVIRAFGFDTTADIPPAVWGDNFGVGLNDQGNRNNVTIDTTVVASGAGSMKMVVPSNSSANGGGDWWTNFSANLSQRFGAGDLFYVQFRQRFSSCRLFGGSGEPCTGPPRHYALTAGSGGWKQANITMGDFPGCVTVGSDPNHCGTSCTPIELVTQNTNQRNFSQMYNGCPGDSQGFEQPFGALDFKLQNARPSPYCLYSTDPTYPGCLSYVPNEWMTFTVMVKIGPTQVANRWPASYVKAWIQRDGQTPQLVQEWPGGTASSGGTWELHADAVGNPTLFGKIYLTTYETNKDPSEVHPAGVTWFDELIVSLVPPAPAAATGTVSGDTTPPTAPTLLSGVAVSSSQINLSWVASTDDVAVTQYAIERCLGTGCIGFAEIDRTDGITYSNVSGLIPGTVYRYRVRAFDAALNASGYSNIAELSTLPSPVTPFAGSAGRIR